MTFSGHCVPPLIVSEQALLIQIAFGLIVGKIRSKKHKEDAVVSEFILNISESNS